MASVHQRTNTRYWAGKFRDHAGRIVMRSTKKTKRSDAMEIVLAWERAAHQAKDGELTQSAILKTLGEMMEKTTGEKNPCFQRSAVL